jgi:hypothetical protein
MNNEYVRKNSSVRERLRATLRVGILISFIEEFVFYWYFLEARKEYRGGWGNFGFSCCSLHDAVSV